MKQTFKCISLVSQVNTQENHPETGYVTVTFERPDLLKPNPDGIKNINSDFNLPNLQNGNLTLVFALTSTIKTVPFEINKYYDLGITPHDGDFLSRFSFPQDK